MTKTVLVTGATAGIGAGTARAFVAAGWRVIGTGRRADRLQALADELGGAFHPLAFDITDEDALDAALNSLPPEFAEVNLG